LADRHGGLLLLRAYTRVYKRVYTYCFANNKPLAGLQSRVQEAPLKSDHRQLGKLEGRILGKEVHSSIE
jgi:hypothetical protein